MEKNFNQLFQINLYKAILLLVAFFASLNAQSFENLDRQVLNDLQINEELSALEFDPVSGKKEKIIIAGDSWAVFPCLFGSMRRMLHDNDYPLVSDKRCFRTSRLGIRANQWLGSGPDVRLTRFLKNDTRIKYIYLSLGGNDVMTYWNTSFKPEDEQKLFQMAYDIMEKIIAKYSKLRPDVKIIISGYDYGRLADRNLIPLYTMIYHRMHNPTPEQLNNLLTRFSDSFQNLANGRNIFYIQHLGLSHYYNGVPEKGLPAYKTMSPDEISSHTFPAKFGGDRKLPNGKKSMLNWIGLSRDAIHLSSKNYYYTMKHTYDNVIKFIINQSTSETTNLQK